MSPPCVFKGVLAVSERRSDGWTDGRTTEMGFHLLLLKRGDLRRFTPRPSFPSPTSAARRSLEQRISSQEKNQTSQDRPDHVQ